MTALRIKAVIVLVLAMAAFAGAAAWRPTVHMADSRAKVDLESLFPKAFGNWVVDDRMPVQLVSPDTAALLNKIYNQTLSRTYVNPDGERIMLSVAYGGDQSDGTRAHRPEVCYPAQGFRILFSETGQLVTSARSFRVRRLVAKLGGRTEPITYWVIVGERVALSGTEQKLAQLRYGVQGVIPDGMLVRVSNISQDATAAFQIQQSFVNALVRALPMEWVKHVVGAPDA